MNVKKILLPTDFSDCCKEAFDYAVYWAQHFDAELHMLHAIVLHEEGTKAPVQMFENTQQYIEKAATTEMTRLVHQLESNSLKVRKVQKRGISVAPVVLEYAEENEIDLIVLGTHGRRGIQRLLLGSVAEEVVRLAPCPVMTIRASETARKPDSVKNILVPIDFSEHSRQSLAAAGQIATIYGAKIQVLHVIQETVHPSFYVTGKTSVFDLVPDIRKKATEALKKAVHESVGAAVEADLFVREGRPSAEITKSVTDYRSDLIVIATHGLTGIESMMVGSAAERVVRMAPCPVLTVKSFGKKIF